ncbi:DegT/DnrJ/EryC1/StrS family aminotransferase [Kibdelosporangium phytohabitans]|uniref:Pyridoxal phosphate-dependent aminotransferase n=1 Tax=Kibdelosporangium phytohabitans TaxID=860235 RepID=A0A0N9HRD9_9PSEU|nr:DegT/DnrJ/EryC1/StrS family aminotransferase [Kibdelosporangium phytohabitans]ALG05672.1 pyridoxal phosphate-dependent aminotransferase [Kibdelosporangium phytohabitans]MBE1466347.1 dTDP-4-amino-4,6-dideoxygalactose transaminase [Kibdelosporangium phytohabitans]
MPDPIILGQPTVGAEELAAVEAVFKSGWLAGAGPTSRKFEERFAQAAGTSHALATSSCGTALHLSMLLHDVKPGDEVIVADYTFPATGHAVIWAGATPVFADIRPDIWTVDPAAVEAAITPRTVGVIAVDVFGQPADYDELNAITKKHGLFLVEDAACSAGATYKGRKAGSLADLAVFSFHGRKVITAGEGGAVTSDNADLMARARRLHTYGIEPAFAREGSRELPIPTFEETGYNYRLSDVQAAIMQVQLDRLPDLIAARTRAAVRYNELFKDLELVTTPVALPDREHPWQCYALTIDPSIGRDEVVLRLRDRGVGCNFGTYASHIQPIYGRDDKCPVSLAAFRQQLAIPMHANLTEDEVERVGETVRDVVTELAAER